MPGGVKKGKSGKKKNGSSGEDSSSSFARTNEVTTAIGHTSRNIEVGAASPTASKGDQMNRERKAKQESQALQLFANLKVCRYGHLGLHVLHPSQEEVQNGISPGSSTAVMDAATLRGLQDVSEAERCSSAIYDWLGMEEHAPEVVLARVTAEGEAMGYEYAEDKYVIHVVAPQLKSVSSDSALNELSMAYCSVLLEFIVSKRSVLRLVPFSFMATSRERAQTTFEALRKAFLALPPDPLEELYRLSSDKCNDFALEFCIFREVDYESYFTCMEMCLKGGVARLVVQDVIPEGTRSEHNSKGNLLEEIISPDGLEGASILEETAAGYSTEQKRWLPIFATGPAELFENLIGGDGIFFYFTLLASLERVLLFISILSLPYLIHNYTGGRLPLNDMSGTPDFISLTSVANFGMWKESTSDSGVKIKKLVGSGILSLPSTILIYSSIDAISTLLLFLFANWYLIEFIPLVSSKHKNVEAFTVYVDHLPRRVSKGSQRKYAQHLKKHFEGLLRADVCEGDSVRTSMGSKVVLKREAENVKYRLKGRHIGVVVACFRADNTSGIEKMKVRFKKREAQEYKVTELFDSRVLHRLLTVLGEPQKGHPVERITLVRDEMCFKSESTFARKTIGPADNGTTLGNTLDPNNAGENVKSARAETGSEGRNDIMGDVVISIEKDKSDVASGGTPVRFNSIVDAMEISKKSKWKDAQRVRHVAGALTKISNSQGGGRTDSIGDRDVVGAFVTFTFVRQRDFVFDFFRFSRSLLLSRIPTHYSRFQNAQIRVLPASKSSDVFWENLSYPYWKRVVRSLIVFATCLLIMVLSIVLSTLAQSQRKMSTRPSYADCEQTSLTIAYGDADARRNCGCVLRGFANVIRDKPPGIFGKCKEWSTMKAKTQGWMITLSFSTAIVNYLILLTISWLSGITKPRSLTSLNEHILSMSNNLLCINLCVITMIAGAKLDAFWSVVTLGISANGTHEDITPEWIVEIGATIATTLGINVIVSSLSFASQVPRFYSMIFCCKRRSMKFRRLFGYGTARDLYTPPPYDIATRHSQILSHLCVCIAFAGCYPICWVFALAICVISYRTDKFVLLRASARLPEYDGLLARYFVETLKLATVAHFFFGFLVFGNANTSQSYTLSDVWESTPILGNITHVHTVSYVRRSYDNFFYTQVMDRLDLVATWPHVIALVIITLHYQWKLILYLVDECSDFMGTVLRYLFPNKAWEHKPRFVKLLANKLSNATSLYTETLLTMCGAGTEILSREDNRNLDFSTLRQHYGEKGTDLRYDHRSGQHE